MTASTLFSNVYVSGAISGVFAGLVAIFVTFIIERWGGIVGGVLGSIPTTIVPAAVGFWLQCDPSSNVDIAKFQNSLLGVVPGMLINSVFLWVWKALPPKIEAKAPTLSIAKFLSLMAALSLLVWLVLAIAAVLILKSIASLPVSDNGTSDAYTATIAIFHEPQRIGSFVVALACFSIQLGLGIYNSWNVVAAPKGKSRVGPLIIFLRGLLAAAAIFVSLLISRINDFAGGVASIFPAIFLTSMVSLWISQSASVPVGATGPLMLGSLSVSFFAMCSCFLVTLMNPVGAFVLCWIASVAIVSVPSFYTSTGAAPSRIGGRPRLPPRKASLASPRISRSKS
ncbi:uncharacterized protein BJ171DRAFT_500680 [Polychytrium aggregatum]|uniref:uncharacterized protein n=1 Tax=Polychytrium aggregatum TaxID=110093 RepID=UPI0022FF11F4|nr:uncharacterized protein BJ171DRAFT_500680 [Polychytrium aggregatum]KAI9205518.1 hypothetical protein BJ171DRAFT_500680 [Polychytrium aggregatum]